MASVLNMKYQETKTCDFEEQNSLTGTDEEDVPKCSYLSFKPPCLQHFARPVVFLLAASIFYFADGFLVGVVQGTITSIEHRYQLTLRQMGMMQSSFCLGGIIGILLLIPGWK